MSQKGALETNETGSVAESNPQDNPGSVDDEKDDDQTVADGEEEGDHDDDTE